MSNLLDKASVILTPTAYNNGEALCIKPSDGSGDFDFSRNSAATRVNAQGLVENVQILSSNLVQNGDFSEEGAEEVSNGSFSQEGVEEVTNGSFDTDLSGWQVIDSATGIDITWTENGVSFITDGAGGGIQQSVMTIGKYYLIEFDYTAVSGGIQLSPYFGSIDETKRYSGIFEATTTNISFYRNNSFGNTEGLIDNVSVREVGQDWTLGTGWGIAEDKATVDNTVNASLDQTCLTSGKTYKVSFEISDLQAGGNITIGDIVTPSAYTATSNGSQTFYYTATNSTLRVRGKGYPCSITNISVKEVGMDWNSEQGIWTFGDGVANGNGATSASEELAQNLSASGIAVGDKVKLSFEIKNYVSGSVQAVGIAPTASKSANGIYEYIGEVTSANFRMRGSSFQGSVTNISVIQVTSDTNLPRINYEGFSYQDALGSEQVVNGTFDNGSANWSVGSNSEINNGSARIYSPSGGYTFISQSNVLTIGKTYLISLEIVEQNLGEIRLSDGSGYLSNSFSGVGIHTFKSTSLGTILRIQRTASITDIRIDNVSVKEYLGQEVVPNSGCGSWLFESQSTNLITYSSDYTQWNKSGSMVITSNNAISPDGTQNASLLTANAANQFIYLTGFSSTNSTISLYIKRKTGTGSIELSNNGGASYTVLSVTDEWSRVQVTFATSTNQTVIKINTSGDEIYLWGVQLEALSYASSYIPTSGSSVTRNQDVCNNGGSLATINSTEGVLYLEASRLSDLGTCQIGLFGSSSNEQIRIEFNNSSIRAQLYNGSYQVNMTSSQTVTNNNKIAFKYKENDFALWINGVEVLTDNSGVTFNADELIKFNLSNGTGALPFFGKTKAVAVWKEALSDQELADLTYPTPTDPTFTLDFDTIAEQFTFARGSEATYVDAQGLIKSTNEIGEELVVNGGFATDSDWSKGTGWSIANGVASHTGGASYLSQSILEADTQYKVDISVTEVSGGGFVQIYMGNSPASVLISTIGDYTYYFTSQLIQTLGFALRSLGDVTIDNVSVKEYITATNTPRLDYSTGAEAFLLEPQSTNLVTDSQNYNSTYWGGQRGTLSDGGVGLFYLSPTSNVIKYEATQTQFNQMYYRLPSAVPIGNTYTQQGYVKCDDAPYIHFQISALTGNPFIVWDNVNNVVVSSDPSIDSYNITSLSDGWVKAEITYTATVASIYASLKTYFSTSSTVNWAGVTVGTIAYQTFVQVEELPFASSYIPSNGSQTTRNQETCINATPEINSEEGVLYAEISALTDGGSYRIISLSDGTDNNRVIFFYDVSINRLSYQVRVGGAGQMSGAINNVSVLQFNKIALKYKENDFALWINGVEVATDTVGNTFPLNTLTKLNFSSGNGTSNFYGNTKDLQYYTKALSDAELIKLTTI